jgi:L-threonylcarbamoyladenylate synthase
MIKDEPKMTKVWIMNPQKIEAADSGLQEAARWLREGKRVAFPTETVYGLGADARSAEAVAGIFAAKGRPSDNPLIVHIADRSQLGDLTDADRLDETSRRLMDAFWPGPLTLVLPAKPGAVAANVTAGLPTVAVRMPDHPVALRLIEAAGCPVAAPSANRSGRPSPTRASHVLADLDGLIDGIVDGGPTGVGVESTVVEVVDGVVHVLRPGGVSAEELRRVAGRVEARGELSAALARSGEGRPSSGQLAEEEAAPKSPGMKYAHYAPRGRLTVVSGDSPDRISAWIREQLRKASAEGERTGVLTFEEHCEQYGSEADVVVTAGTLQSPETVARNLYGALRSFDEQNVTVIYAEALEEEGIGLAVMNRLLKAAGHRIKLV